MPPPEECGSFRDPPPPESGLPSEPLFEFWREVIEGRPALGHAPWDTSERDAAEVATWIKFEHLPADENGQFDQPALLVAADMMPAAVFEKVEPIEREWSRQAWISLCISMAYRLGLGSSITIGALRQRWIRLGRSGPVGSACARRPKTVGLGNSGYVLHPAQVAATQR